MNKLSIVIPTLNEADSIGRLITHLVRCSDKNNIADILVVDGGSEDDTIEKVAEYDSASLIISEKGRAKQMNKGAQLASGSILYFLHADSYPPMGFDDLIINEVENGNLAGCFKMKFDHDHWWLRLASWLTKFSWRACRGGDQSQFITKDLFEELGCFDEHFTVYEDNDLINKLYARKQFVVIQEWLTTSARRYSTNGIWRLQFHFWTIYVKKWFGASAEELQRYYLKNII
ncbi:MAG: glycosyltransferase [Flavobacteriaceae bacterium]|nr:TIGR04283 family arsenosugar biosynthesis glycosyltransferase [Bacteroidia bacterium]NNL59724.1 glycosyltransferase [Flavobacteriaceae bacterium]